MRALTLLLGEPVVPQRTWVRIGGAWTLVSYDVVRLDGDWGDDGVTPPPDVAPVVTGHPADVSATAGVPVTIGPVSATGSTPMTLQWYYQDGVATPVSIGGATSSTITVTPSIGENGRKFFCRFTNAAGSADTNKATMTVVESASGAVAFTDDGLYTSGAKGAYATSPWDAAARPTTEFEVVVLATLFVWNTAWADDTNVQSLFALWDASTSNNRIMDVVVNRSGNILVNLSIDGSAQQVVTATPSSPLVAGSTYWIKVQWRSAAFGADPAGTCRVWCVPGAKGDATQPNYGGAIKTQAVHAGQTLYAGQPGGGPEFSFNALNGGQAGMVKGTTHFVQYSKTIGTPTITADFRSATPGASTYAESVTGRVITLEGATEDHSAFNVGMPLGSETPNVGLRASVFGHTPVAYTSLPTQQLTKVITTAMANAATTSKTYNGVTYKVFSLLNVAVAVAVTSTVPVLIEDSKFGQVYANAGSNVRVQWCDIGFGFARTGDNPCLTATIWNGSDNGSGTLTPPSAGCWNFATTLGTGADTIVADDGAFTDTCLKAMGNTTAGKLHAYRCNMWGHTDASWEGGMVPGSLTSLAELVIEECWWHDHLWMPIDQARINQTPLNNSHCDGTKVNAGSLLMWINCRIDAWPILASDVQNLSPTNYWKGPHWGKNPNLAEWPLSRSDSTNRFIGTCWIIDNQATGHSKNVLLDGNIVDGPYSNFVSFRNIKAGTTYQLNVTIRRNHFRNGVINQSTPFRNPRGQPGQTYLQAFGAWVGGTWPASANLNFPITGPDVNYDPDGNPMTVHPKAGMKDSSAFVPT